MASGKVFAARLSRLADLGFRAVDALLVAIFAVLIVLVFANVVLRYLFDSGVSATDELSRMIFIWIAFVGAVCVARRNGHLGVDLLTASLSPRARRVCRVLTDVVIVLCCIVLSVGAWQQTVANLGNIAPVSGLPTALNYLAPFVGGVGIGLVACVDLIAALLGAAEPDHEEGHTA